MFINLVAKLQKKIDMHKKIMTHLKKRIKTDVLGTLKSFKVGESELILYDNSQTDTCTFSSRYQTLKREGAITGVFRFHRSEEPRGTIITRLK